MKNIKKKKTLIRNPGRFRPRRHPLHKTATDRDCPRSALLFCAQSNNAQKGISKHRILLFQLFSDEKRF